MPKFEFEQADMTNPEHLKMHGLKLKGRKIVTQGNEVEIGELTDEEAKRLGIHE